MSGGWTKGPVFARRATKPDNTGGFDWAIVAAGNFIVAECFEHPDYSPDGTGYLVLPAEANAALIAEAFNVANETGLSPRQLADQRADLLAALEGVIDILGRAESNASGNPEFDYVGPRVANVRAALAKTTGVG